MQPDKRTKVQKRDRAQSTKNEEKKKPSFLTYKNIKIFNIVSVCFILGCFMFYGGRLLYFVSKQNAPSDSTGVFYLKDELIKRESLIDLSQGLVKNEDGSYTYKGNPADNYLSYSGRTFRVVGLDSSGNIKVIAEKCDTVMICSPSLSYEDCVIRRWLNKLGDEPNTGIYHASLNAPMQYLVATSVGVDTVNDLKDITSNEYFTQDYITLLSLYDYKEAGGANSYLNNSDSWYLSTTNSSGHYWYVSSDGGLAVALEDFSVFGIRPVLTLRADVAIISGDGTQESPYTIEPEKKVETAYDASVGSYFLYGNYSWRMGAKSSDAVTLLMDEPVSVSGAKIKKDFGSSQIMDGNNEASPAAYYLNHDFLNTLGDKSVLVEGLWYTGAYKTLFGYDYRDTYSSSYTGYVGTVKIGDMYLNTVYDVFTSTGAFEDSRLIFTVNSAGGLFADYVSNEHMLRPAVYVNINTPVISGSGTQQDPFVLDKLDFVQEQ